MRLKGRGRLLTDVVEEDVGGVVKLPTHLNRGDHKSVPERKRDHQPESRKGMKFRKRTLEGNRESSSKAW
jgi:hypothetical protein